LADRELVLMVLCLSLCEVSIEHKRFTVKWNSQGRSVFYLFLRVSLTHISVHELQVGDAGSCSTRGWREDFSGSVKENLFQQKLWNMNSWRL